MVRLKQKGHVRQRSNGKWECSLPRGYGVDGKKKRLTKGGFETKEEAEQGLIKLAYEVSLHMVVEHSKEKLYNYLRYWIDAESEYYKPSWLKNLIGYVENYIKGDIGNVKLCSLTPSHLEMFYKTLRKNGKSPQTIKHVHNMLSKALNKAVRMKLISENPAQLVSKSIFSNLSKSQRKRKPTIWTMDELMYFAKFARGSRWYIGFLLATATGARQGEILAIRWENIDFENNLLTIDSSINRDMKGYKLGDPKTDSSYRTIDLPPYIMDELWKHRERRYEKDARHFNKPEDFVVRTWDGTFVSQRNFAREWYRLLEESGLPKIRFHDLRHTHATLLLESGANILYVSERLGHSKTSTTYNIYSHMTKKMRYDGTAIMENQYRASRIVLEPPAEG